MILFHNSWSQTKVLAVSAILKISLMSFNLIPCSVRLNSWCSISSYGKITGDINVHLLTGPLDATKYLSLVTSTGSVIVLFFINSLYFANVSSKPKSLVSGSCIKSCFKNTKHLESISYDLSLASSNEYFE